MVLWSAVTWKRLINNNLGRLINFRNLQGKQLLEQNQINDVMNEKKGKEQKIWSKTDIALWLILKWPLNLLVISSFYNLFFGCVFTRPIN